MLDIHSLINNLGHKYTPETLSEIVASLVKKGIMEQYTDENGDFGFKLTTLGIDSAQDIINDPVQFFDLELDLDDEDGLV